LLAIRGPLLLSVVKPVFYQLSLPVPCGDSASSG
jgi:hypothetical protein